MMSAENKVGVVVIGLGTAGKVRVRDLKEETCSLRLKGVVSRRPVELEDVKSYSLEEAVSAEDVQAVIVCSEPCTHEEYVSKALKNGKHVLVEYPIALSSDKAKEFYALAEEKGLILREENIALLTTSYAEVYKKAMTTKLTSGTYSLKGKFNGWLEDFDKSGLPFITGVSGLQVLISTFGSLTVDGAKLERHEDGGYTATASLRTEDGSVISMTLGRYVDQSRTKEQTYTFADGEVIDTNKVYNKEKDGASKIGLFMQDLQLFSKAIQSGKIPEEEKNLTISSLELAEKIHSHFS